MKKGVKRTALFILIVVAVAAFLMHAHKKYNKVMRSFDDEPVGV